jgi:hypothetical protein
MKKEYIINKDEIGLVFTFSNPYLSEDKYGGLEIAYKVSGTSVDKTSDKDGKLHRAKFNDEKRRIDFWYFKFNGKEIDGLLIPDEMSNELHEIYVDLLAKRNKLIKETIDNIIDGKILIHYYYSPANMDISYSNNIGAGIHESLSRLHWDILEKVIKKITGEIALGDSPYDYLKSRIGYRVWWKGEDNINPKAQNIVFGENGYIISFDISLIDNISDLEEIKKRTEEEKVRIESRKKEKESMILTIIKKGKDNTGDGVDYYANVELEDVITHEKLKFVCRNIFDFGYVVNPDYEIAKGKKGGIENNGMWQTFQEKGCWKDVRALTDFEKKCLDYLYKFSPIGTGIRL